MDTFQYVSGYIIAALVVDLSTTSVHWQEEEAYRCLCAVASGVRCTCGIYTLSRPAPSDYDTPCLGTVHPSLLLRCLITIRPLWKHSRTCIPNPLQMHPLRLLTQPSGFGVLVAVRMGQFGGGT